MATPREATKGIKLNVAQMFVEGYSVNEFVYIYVYIYVCICVYMYMCVSVYMCVLKGK